MIVLFLLVIQKGEKKIQFVNLYYTQKFKKFCGFAIRLRVVGVFRTSQTR